jgi:hypothetical protein
MNRAGEPAVEIVWNLWAKSEMTLSVPSRSDAISISCNVWQSAGSDSKATASNAPKPDFQYVLLVSQKYPP